MKSYGAALANRDGGAGRVFGYAIDLALICLLALLAAKIFWAVTSPAASVDIPGIRSSAQNGPEGRQLVYDPGIFNRFNPFNREIEAADIVVAAAPQTTLNLEIKALYASNIPEEGSVRIKLPDNSVKRFGPGDIVVNGVRVDEILPDRVVLTRNGTREVLYANTLSVLATEKPSVTVSPDEGNSSLPVQAAPVEPVQLSNTRQLSFEAFYEKVQLRRVASESGGTVLVVQPSSDGAVLSQIGLRAGDQLLFVNGYDLSDESIADLAEKLRNESQLEIGLLRDGNLLTQMVNLR